MKWKKEESPKSRTAGSFAFAVMLVVSSFLGLSAFIIPYVDAAPSVGINYPMEGQMIYGDTLTLNLTVSDFMLNGSAIGGANVPGEGHWHLYINGQLIGPFADEEIELTDLPAGQHLIEVELVNNDHSSLDPAVKDSANIEIVYPMISIVSPIEDAILYGGMIHLNVEIENFTLSEDVGGANVPGEGHWHLYINDVLQGPYTKMWANLTELPAGQHTFKVDLRNNDHSPISPPSEHMINVTVVEEMPELMVKNLPMHAIGYGGILDIQVGVMNFTLTEDYGMMNVPGEGHVHLYINDALIGPYSSEWINLTELPAGEHDFRLELRNNDHSMLYPAVHYEFMVTIVEEVPSIEIIEPMDHVIFYKDSIDLELQVDNFILNGSAMGMMSVPGEGHYHLLINDALIGPSVDLMRTLEDLPAGNHVLKVELYHNDHTPLMPRVMDMIHFTIVDDDPMIMIGSPMDMAYIYDSSLHLEVMVHNFTLNASAVGMDNVPGEGHYHIYINDDLVGPFTNLSVMLEDLPVGQHVLKVMLVNNDHSPVMPEAMDMIDFMILEERPHIAIDHPMNGAVLYKNDLEINVMVQNFTLNASAIGGNRSVGEGHYHVFINDVLVGPFTNLSIMLEDLPAGTHELMVLLVNNDHSPVMPYSMDMVLFTIVNETPSISIVEPMDGEYFYGDMLHVEVMIENFMMNASAIGGNNSVGEGHWHLYINGNLVGPYSDMMAQLSELPAGTHELKVELRNNDHSPLMPVFMDMVTFTLLEAPMITIVSPDNGTSINGSSLELEVEVTDLMLNSSAIGGTNMPGEGHYHIYINDDLVGPFTNLTVMLEDLPAGDHVLKVELRNNDHSELGVEAMDMLYFTIQEPPTEIEVTFGPVMSGDDPVEGVMVTLMYGGSEKSAETDSMGYATFMVPVEWEGMDVDYEIKKDGYETISGTGTLDDNGMVDIEGDIDLEKESDDPNLIVILVLVVVIVLVLIVLAYLLTRRSNEEQYEE